MSVSLLWHRHLIDGDVHRRRAVAAEMQRGGDVRWGDDILDTPDVPLYSLSDVPLGITGAWLC